MTHLAEIIRAPVALVELMRARRKRRNNSHSDLLNGHGEKDVELTESQLRLARNVGRAISLTSRYSRFSFSCLDEALAARCWLRRLGIQSEIEFGARRRGAIFDAHAWLSVGGQVIVGERQATYSAFRPIT